VWHRGHAVFSALSEKEISDLTLVVVIVNSWNRLNIDFKTMPGSADAKFGLAKAALN
jgi:alkylhydroperoxidase family enzyme